MQLIAVVRIVHRGRDRLQRNIDNLQHAKLDVLLQRPRRSHIEGACSRARSLRPQPLALRHHRQRNRRRNKMAHAAQHANPHVILLRQLQQPLRVDEADISRLRIRHRISSGVGGGAWVAAAAPASAATA